MAKEDLIESIDQLKAALLGVVTGSTVDYNDDDYRRVRKTILNHPQLSERVPEWLRRGSTIAEVNSRIRSMAGDASGMWQRRREIVTSGLNPLIDVLDQSDTFSAGNLDKSDRIGGGGFGEVYRARHRLLDLDFALKILNPVFESEQGNENARFFREARILLRLSHANIVRVFDVGLIGRRPYIQLELIEGRSLREILQESGRLTPERARSIFQQLSSALAYAHHEGVVHRDIKPSNIMIADERAVLLDFGLGAFIEDEIVSRITRTGEAPAGSVYTAPELLQDPKRLEPSDDIYSLGAVWYETLVGRAPAGSRIARALREVEDLLDEEYELIMRCVAPDDERPDAIDIERALRRL